MILISFFVAILNSCLDGFVRADLGADAATRAPRGIYCYLAFIRYQRRAAQQVNAYLAVAGKATLRFLYRRLPAQTRLYFFKVALSLGDRQRRLGSW
jgi:hypothetical protein